MSDEAHDNPAPTDPHVPWDSIGGSDESIESLSGGEDSQSEKDADSLLTPGADRSADPDCLEGSEGSEHEQDQPMAALRSAPAWEASESESDSSERVRSRNVPEEEKARGGGWTIPVLCAGIALIACSVLIPQADANRRLAYEKQTLTRDLQSIEQQIDVNREFLKKVSDDPTLAQRLAERQMKVIPQGAHVVDLTHEPESMSPFQLLNVAPPAPLPPYRPVGGTLARICYGPHSRLYLIGLSLGMIATGLVLGAAPSGAGKS